MRYDKRVEGESVIWSKSGKKFWFDLTGSVPCDMCGNSNNIIFSFAGSGSLGDVNRLCFACIHDCIEESHETAGFPYIYRPKGLEIEVEKDLNANNNQTTEEECHEQMV